MKKTTLYIKKITKRLAIKMLIPLGLLLFGYTALAQTTSIPDINFENALAQLGLDNALDGQVLTANISGITTLDVSGRSISDLSGIEDFTALQTLNCSNNNLTALTLSSNLALTSINASSNNLPTISFFNNASLVTVDLSFNQLVGVSIRNGANNNLLTFNVNFNPSLGCVIIDDENNPAFVFSPLDANPDIFLVEDVLDCSSTVIPDANFEQALIDLGIDTGIVNGRVRTSSINAITTLDISNRNINDLTGIEDFTALLSLNCDGNNLTTLDLSNNTTLQGLTCQACNLTILDLSSNAALEALFVNDNNLRTLNIQNGNNTNFATNVDLTGNANLNCIVVDDPNNVPTTISANALASATFTDDPAICAATISIPDANFEQALIDLGIDTGTTNGQVRVVDITGITTLDIRNRNINDLTGIEGFSALTTLSCQLNNLTSLDVSNNTVLEILNCDENDLTSLSLPTTNTLTGLLCRTNEFVTLDFSDQEALTILFVGNNTNLEILNIKNGNNTNLTQFNATVNTTNLSCIVVDDASNVPSVIANGTPAGANFIDSLSECDAFTLIPDMNFEQVLIDLGIDSGTINGSVLTSSIATVTFLDVTNRNISDLTGIEDFVALEFLGCSINNLTALDVSNNTALGSLTCGSNDLTVLDLSNNTALLSLRISNTNLTALDLSNQTELENLFVFSNQLTSLDLSNQVELTRLVFGNPNLEVLNIKNGNNTNLVQFGVISDTESLSCIVVDDSSNVPTIITDNTPVGVNFIENLSDCGAVTLIPDVNFEQALIDLGIDSGTVNGSVLTSSINTITGLDVSSSNISDLTGIEDFVALQSLVCNNNNLVDLNVSNNTALLSLVCEANNLTALDLSNNTALFILRFANNNLTEIDLSNNTALIALSCIGNNLTSLDLSNNMVLNNLNVASNPNLEVLNIKNGNNTNFVQFNATSTQNLSCIVVDDSTNVPTIITDNAPAGVNFTEDASFCATLSISDEVLLVENTIAVYPNPSSDKVFIKNNSNVTLTNVKVFNLLGSLVLQTNGTEEIDVTRLPNGIYMIRIATDTGNVFTKRVIKQ